MKSFLKKYINKFKYAFDGLYAGLRHDRSIALQGLIALAVIAVCGWLRLSWLELMVIIAMILLVLGAEFINSAMEELCDALYPEYDVRAKKIKDYAAAAVLLFAILAAVVGLTVIGGKLF